MRDDGDLKQMTDEQKRQSWERMNYKLDAALGITPQEFGYMQDDFVAAWFDAMLKAEEQVCSCSAEPKTFDEMGKAANLAFQSCISPITITSWEVILPEYRLKWQFLVRHMANMIEWTEEEDPIVFCEDALTQLFKEALQTIPKETVS